MTVAELIAELERAPRAAKVRAVVVNRDHVTVAAGVERVHVAGTKSVGEGAPKDDVVIVAGIDSDPVKQPDASQWRRSWLGAPDRASSRDRGIVTAAPITRAARVGRILLFDHPVRPRVLLRGTNSRRITVTSS